MRYNGLYVTISALKDYRKPEVVIAELLDGYNMVYNVVASIARALWAIIGDK